jgi:hypothetical protein
MEQAQIDACSGDRLGNRQRHITFRFLAGHPAHKRPYKVIARMYMVT